MDDFIFRDDILVKLSDLSDTTLVGVGSIRKSVQKIPAADVRPVVHGHWIEHIEHDEETDCDVPDGFECSECGRWEQYKEPFCNCGAMMDERS